MITARQAAMAQQFAPMGYTECGMEGDRLVLRRDFGRDTAIEQLIAGDGRVVRTRSVSVVTADRRGAHSGSRVMTAIDDGEK